MLGALMTIWSLMIMPLVFKIYVSLGNDLMPSGYVDLKTIGFSIRFDWKTLQTENGLKLQLRFANRKHAHERSISAFQHMSPQTFLLLRNAPMLRKQLLGYLRSIYVKADISLGLSDAAATALACGGLHAVFGCLPHMKAHVTPVFCSESICLNARCIASFRLGKLLLSAALYLHASMMQRMRQKAGGAAYGKSASD